MPAPHHLIFTGWMLFLTRNQQYQSSEGITFNTDYSNKIAQSLLDVGIL